MCVSSSALGSVETPSSSVSMRLSGPGSTIAPSRSQAPITRSRSSWWTSISFESGRAATAPLNSHRELREEALMADNPQGNGAQGNGKAQLDQLIRSKEEELKRLHDERRRWEEGPLAKALEKSGERRQHF